MFSTDSAYLVTGNQQSPTIPFVVLCCYLERADVVLCPPSVFGQRGVVVGAVCGRDDSPLPWPPQGRLLRRPLRQLSTLPPSRPRPLSLLSHHSLCTCTHHRPLYQSTRLSFFSSQWSSRGQIYRIHCNTHVLIQELYVGQWLGNSTPDDT